MKYKEFIQEDNMEKYKCQSSVCVGCCFDPCDYIYDPEVGDPAHGINPGTPFEDIPKTWSCPSCGAGPEVFKKLDK